MPCNAKAVATSFLALLALSALGEESAALKLYRRLELPLAPKDAQLVMITDGVATAQNYYELAWRVSGKDGFEYLVGPVRSTHKSLINGDRRVIKLVTEAEALKVGQIDYQSFAFDHPFEADASLGMAMQLEAAGYPKLGAKILASPKMFPYFGYSAKTTEQRVSFLAVAAIFADFSEPGADAKRLIKKLEQALGYLPKKDFPWVHDFLSDRKTSLQPSKSAPGSIEALIDELTNVGAQTRFYQIGIQEDRFDRLISRGFEAVPALIAHLTDKRQTLLYMPRMNNRGPHFVRVGTICMEIIAQMMSPRFVNRGVLYDDQDPKAWWGKVSKLDERTYFESVLFPGSDKQDAGLSMMPINEVAFRILVLKLPESLPNLYRKSLTLQRVYNRPLAESIHQGKLPDPEKDALLMEGARASVPEHRQTALYFLKKRSPEAMRSLLEAAIGSPNPFGEGAYWLSPARTFASWTVEHGDERTFAALCKAMKSSPLGHRVEAMQGLTGVSSKNKDAVKRCVDLLRQFFEDRDLYDPAEHRLDIKTFNNAEDPWMGPGALMGFETAVSGGDFAHYCVDLIIGGEAVPRRPQSREEWSKYRALVKAKLARWWAPT